MKVIHSLGRHLRLTMVVLALLLATKSVSLFAAVSGLDVNRLGNPRSAGVSTEARAATVRQSVMPTPAAVGQAASAATVLSSTQSRSASIRPGAISSETGKSPVQRDAARSAADTSAPAPGAISSGADQPERVPSGGSATNRLTANTLTTDPTVMTMPQSSGAGGQRSATMDILPDQTSQAIPPSRSSLASADTSSVESFTPRQNQLAEHDRQLAEREAVAAATEKRLSDRVVELSALQNQLQALQSALQERDEANWAGLVKLYESMRPREAAAIFNSLDKKVLLQLLDRMKPGKASLILASMEPEKARQITTDLAARRTQSTTVVN